MSKVEEYISSCKISERVKDSLEELFSQNDLPYNPYRKLMWQFLGHSECFHMTKSHLETGISVPTRALISILTLSHKNMHVI